MTVSSGLESTLAALDGALGPEDEALVELARGLAAAVEADPSIGALWKEYRAAVTQLREAASGAGGDDDTAEFYDAVRAPVGDAAQ
jgi:hypothetical protein